MNTVTYITDTNADRYLIIDGQRETAAEWFKAALPGDEVEALREALIEAIVRMSGEDRELLVSNGFAITELPLAYTEADEARAGSSPRGRGKRVLALGLRRAGGLIPAWAGKTHCAAPIVGGWRAHPRVGGENVAAPARA